MAYNVQFKRQFNTNLDKTYSYTYFTIINAVHISIFRMFNFVKQIQEKCTVIFIVFLQQIFQNSKLIPPTNFSKKMSGINGLKLLLFYKIKLRLISGSDNNINFKCPVKNEYPKVFHIVLIIFVIIKVFSNTINTLSTC